MPTGSRTSWTPSAADRVDADAAAGRSRVRRDRPGRRAQGDRRTFGARSLAVCSKTRCRARCSCSSRGARTACAFFTGIATATCWSRSGSRRGTYRLPWPAEQGRVVIEAAELLLVLEGIELRGAAASRAMVAALRVCARSPLCEIDRASVESNSAFH